ncbi:MAG: hypothetical protein HZB38_14380 [Planctomycetes bacterium]|nr:hypothetical protein [Planctomycetota bacterium]
MRRSQAIAPDWADRLQSLTPSWLAALLMQSPAQAPLPGRWEELSKPGLGTRQRWRWTPPGTSDTDDSGVVYVKRYGPPGPRTQWDRIYRQAARHSRAYWEFERSRELNEAEIAAPRAVAFIEEMNGALEHRSAVLLESVPGRPLDRLLPELLATRDPRMIGIARHDLAARLGRFVAAFHGTGLCHRDLYLCHIFAQLDEAAARPPRLAVIDLARTHRPRLFRPRWIIKDLAQLDYSARQAGLSRTDRYRTLCAYLGLAPGTPRLRWYARRVTRKADAIERRDRRKALQRNICS